MMWLKGEVKCTVGPGVLVTLQLKSNKAAILAINSDKVLVTNKYKVLKSSDNMI